MFENGKTYQQQNRIFRGEEATVRTCNEATSPAAEARFLRNGSRKGIYAVTLTVLSDRTELDWYHGAPVEVKNDLTVDDWSNRSYETIAGMRFVRPGRKVAG